MPSADYMRRLETLLNAKVEELELKETKRHRRPLQILGAVAGAVAFFFVLKAAALSHSGQPLGAPLAAEAGLSAQIYHWFAGADPITTTLAAAIRRDLPPARAAL
ncbi:hypothetical protein [Pararhodobacter sp.]|uniref:hypothetical protein n=1 Tax=Pararhodobacter sp. TaxID=2127056 RepID=UPI002AFE1F17|nr:hypothetical protein [Pararhodobacter sp.]